MLNVLLVDDDVNDVEAIRRGMAQSTVPHRFFHASTGAEGLRLLSSREVPAHQRLVLLDRNMPGMSGHEFLQTLRADPTLASIPVVVLTAMGDVEGRQALHSLGVAGYFIKPYEYPKLVSLLDIALRYWSAVELF